MVVDTSAILGVILHEESAPVLREKLRGAPEILVSATAVTEALIVLGSRLQNAKQLVDRFLHDTRATVVPYTGLHADLAFEAFSRFGKGRHPAGLNFGDCMSYAVAKSLGADLLYVGDDFSRTDIKGA